MGKYEVYTNLVHIALTSGNIEIPCSVINEFRDNYYVVTTGIPSAVRYHFIRLSETNYSITNFNLISQEVMLKHIDKKTRKEDNPKLIDFAKDEKSSLCGLIFIEKGEKVLKFYRGGVLDAKLPNFKIPRCKSMALHSSKLIIQEQSAISIFDINHLLLNPDSQYRGTIIKLLKGQILEKTALSFGYLFFALSCDKNRSLHMFSINSFNDEVKDREICRNVWEKSLDERIFGK